MFMKKFNDFTNESIRGAMKPKSSDEIKNNLDKLSMIDRIITIKKRGLDKSLMPTIEELTNNMPTETFERIYEIKKLGEKHNINLEDYMPSDEEWKDALNNLTEKSLKYACFSNSIPTGSKITIDGDFKWYGDGDEEVQTENSLILPNNLTINGDFVWYHDHFNISLPHNLTIKGDCEIGMCAITSLPKYLKVGGNLIIPYDNDGLYDSVHNDPNITIDGKIVLGMYTKNHIPNKIIYIQHDDVDSFYDLVKDRLK